MPQAVLRSSDITTDHAAYAARRQEVFSRLVPLRRERRIRLGDLLALEFENAETLRIQVQEMVYVERLTEADAVEHEVEAYSRLLPDSHSLVATLLVELDDPAAIRETLADLDGIQRAVALRIGDSTVPGVEIPGPDEDPDEPSETVSVHMLRFPLTDEQRDAFRDPAVPAEVVVDHPAYADAAPISGPTRLALLADLAL
jgi:hypothetical protein